MKQAKVSPRRTAVLVAGFVICALVLGLLVVRRYQHSQTPPPAPTGPVQASSRLVALFFAAPEADGLVREGREIDGCSDQTECIQQVLQELQNGPIGEYEPTLPEAAPLPTVTLQGDLALLDLSQELVDELPAGSAAELATVYSLVNTITVNFPQVRRVRLLVAGQPAGTLKGHLDISEPLTQDLSQERRQTETMPPQPGGTGVKR